MRSREGRKDERSALKRNGARGSTLIGGVIHVFVFGTRSTDPDYHNCKVGGSRQRDRRRRSGTPIRLFTNRPPPTFWSPVQPRFRLSVNLPPCRLDRELETTINGQLRRRSKDKHYRRLGKVTRPADLFARLGKSISKYLGARFTGLPCVGRYLCCKAKESTFERHLAFRSVHAVDKRSRRRRLFKSRFLFLLREATTA